MRTEAVLDHLLLDPRYLGIDSFHRQIEVRRGDMQMLLAVSTDVATGVKLVTECIRTLGNRFL